MKHIVAAMVAVMTSFGAGAAEVQPAPNGLTFPADYPDWRVISLSHRVDNNTLRVIVGNDRAVAAARAGETRPWPDGSILGKIVFKQTEAAHWKAAIVPGDFVHAEFMVKNAKAHAGTGGWGFARWVGTTLEPYGKDAGFARECIACHTPVKDNDYVFTQPAPLHNAPR